MLQEEEEEERALDLQMEIDRLKALEAYEERERQRTAESRVGAQILNEQIVERKRERVHQEELRDLVCMLESWLHSTYPFARSPGPKVVRSSYSQLTNMHQFSCMGISKRCIQAAFGMKHACQHSMIAFQMFS